MLTLTQFVSLFGQKKSKDSLPVVIASDQSAIRVNVQSLPTTIPVIVSGTINAAQSGVWNINNITGTVSLPTGAATEATLSTLNGKIPSGLTVTSTRLLVDGSGVTQPVSGNLGRTWTLSSGTDSVAAVQSGTWTVAANAGTNLNTSALALSVTQTDRTQKTQITDGTRDGTVKAASTAAAAGDTSFVVALSPNSALPTGSNTIGALTANQSVNLSQVNGSTVSVGAGNISANSQRIVNGGVSTGTATTVSVTSTSTQLLAANSSRRGFIITNVGGNAVYIGLGFTPTTSSYSFQLSATFPNDTRQFTDMAFTGVINAIRPSGSTNVVITEFV